MQKSDCKLKAKLLRGVYNQNMTESFQRLEDHLDTQARLQDLAGEAEEIALSLQEIMETYNIEKLELGRKPFVQTILQPGNIMDNLLKSQSDKFSVEVRTLHKKKKWNLELRDFAKKRKEFNKLPSHINVLCVRTKTYRTHFQVLVPPKYLSFYADSERVFIEAAAEQTLQKFLENIDRLMNAVDNHLKQQKDSASQSTLKAEKAKKMIKDLLS